MQSEPNSPTPPARIDVELERTAAALYQQVTGRPPAGAVLSRAELLVVKRALAGLRSQINN